MKPIISRDPSQASLRSEAPSTCLKEPTLATKAFRRRLALTMGTRWSVSYPDIYLEREIESSSHYTLKHLDVVRPAKTHRVTTAVLFAQLLQLMRPQPGCGRFALFLENCQLWQTPNCGEKSIHQSTINATDLKSEPIPSRRQLEHRRRALCEHANDIATAEKYLRLFPQNHSVGYFGYTLHRETSFDLYTLSAKTNPHL